MFLLIVKLLVSSNPLKDPLSPYLFITMEEALGRSIKRANQIDIIRVTKSLNNYSPITHHQFIDDTILIGKASIGEAWIMKSILDKYELALD